MTLEIARRLLASGAVSGTQTQTALFLHVTRPMPFLRALLDCGVEPETIESELRRGDLPRLRNVIPAFELVQRLPFGMCAQLLAVPVRLDPITSTVDVAVADPFDSHVRQEFSFHLDSPVRLVQASLTSMQAALAHVEEEERRSPHTRPRTFTPAFGSVAPRIPLPVVKTSSELPIPLVRRSKPPPCNEEDDRGRITRDAIVLDPGSLPAARPSFGDLSTNAFDGIQAESLEIIIPKNSALPEFDAPPDTAPFLTQALIGLESALDDLGRASTRDDVVLAALSGMATVSRRVGVFAVRRESFTGWACTRSFASEAEFQRICVDRRANSVFAHAAAEGWYFGPIPATEAHAQLAALLPDARSEVAIVAVRLQGRPAMLILATQWIDSLIATRTAERLANASAKALLRVLRSEKRQDR